MGASGRGEDMKKMESHRFRPNKKDEAGISNGERAKNAELALRTRNRLMNGVHYSYADDEYGPVDLMADLLHYCDRKGYDGEEVLRSATMHWEAER